MYYFLFIDLIVRNYLLISFGMCYILGLEYLVYVESVFVFFIIDESGGQIVVVSFDKDVDYIKVYVNFNDDDDEYEEEGVGEIDDNEIVVLLDVEDVEIMEIDDGDDDESDLNVDKMDDDDGEDDNDDDEGNDYADDDGDDDDSDDDYSDDEDDDDDYDDDDDEDDDDMDDSDYEFIFKSNVKLLLEKKSIDDDIVLGEGDYRGK